jgi:ATP-dependent Lon protease
MRDFRDAKAMAQTLRDTLKAKSVSLTHSESLEIIARTLGFHDWNVLSAAIQASQSMLAPPRKSLITSPGEATLLPVAPMRDVVFFPHTISPIWVGREKTRRAIDAALAGDGRLLVVTQKRMEDDDPDFEALYSVGVTADIIHHMTMPNGTLRVKVSCTERAMITKSGGHDFLAAEVEPIQDAHEFDTTAFARMREIFDAYQAYTRTPPPYALHRYSREPGVFADVVVQLMEVGIEKTQQILETNDVVARLEFILAWMKDRPPSV